MISLTEVQKQYVLKNRIGTVTINDKEYFFKPDDVEYNVLGLEQVMELFAKKVNIKCPHYDIVEIDDLFFTFSENISNYFFVASKYNIPGFSTLYEIWDKLEESKLPRVDILMFEIVKIYLFDIFSVNGDRNHNNWGIVNKDDNFPEVYILDNEFSFDREYSVLLSSEVEFPISKHGGIEEFNPNSNEDSVLRFNHEDLTYFLKTASSEFIDLLVDMYNTLTPELLEDVIEEVKEINQLPLTHLYYIKDLYRKNYNAIGELIGRYVKNSRS